MPRAAKELSAIEVKRLKCPEGRRGAMVAVGGVAGLYMQLLSTGGRTWILRTKVGDKTRDIGLGGYPDVTLAMARDRAREAKDKIRQGIDPAEERKAARAALAAAQRRGLTFGDAIGKYSEAKLAGVGEQGRWVSSLDRYARPHIGDMLMQDIAVQDVLRVLNQPLEEGGTLWTNKTDTATRVRSRIEAILSWATVAGHRTGDNPARWGGNLKELLPAPSKIAKGSNHPALALADAPAWFAALRQRDGMGARALEFLTLCASRSGEIRGATWDELYGLDGDNPMWVIPASRMKAGNDHRVPLPPQAVALLKALPRFADSPLVFPSSKRDAQLSDMTLSATMRRMHEAEVEAGRKGWLDPRSGKPAVPHGLRSTFRDWAAETGADHIAAELALAHSVGSDVERAYRRSDMVERRREMMTNWAQFLIIA
ncbi:tyrosine-type recombinase/integrase [Paracoccus chinensis]|nr:site-specific integrase [Paracoccus chinensis]